MFALATSSRRWFATAANDNPKKKLINGRWLPFETACAVVQKTGVKTIREWKFYSKTERPPTIPSNPARVYAAYGWRDWYYFFGKEGERRGDVDLTDGAHQYRQAEQRALDISCLGNERSDSEVAKPRGGPGHCKVLDWQETLEVVESKISENFPDIELFRVPRRSSLHLMYRLRGNDAVDCPDCWAPLHITGRRMRRTKLKTRTLHPSVETGIIYVDHTDSGAVYTVRSSDLHLLQKKSLTVNDCIQLGGSHTSTDRLGEVLRHWWRDLPKYSLEELSSICSKTGDVDSSVDLRVQMWKYLFQPIHLTWKPLYSIRPHNSLLGNYKTFQCRVMKKDTGYMIGLVREFNRCQLPFDQIDAVTVDFVIVTVPDNLCESSSQHSKPSQINLLGLYIFPFSFFSSYFSYGNRVGSKYIPVYPPLMQPTFRSTKQKQREQFQYYYDLSIPEARQQSCVKLQKFLAQNPPKQREAETSRHKTHSTTHWATDDDRPVSESSGRTAKM
jgi:hypothetical protein